MQTLNQCFNKSRPWLPKLKAKNTKRILQINEQICETEAPSEREPGPKTDFFWGDSDKLLEKTNPKSQNQYKNGDLSGSDDGDSF